MPKTLFDKIWDRHLIAELPGGISLLHVDRHLLHELTTVAAIAQMEKRGATISRPDLTFATVDHVISTEPGRTGGDKPWSAILVDGMREKTTRLGIKRFDIDNRQQGIVHIIGPELGLTLPGVLLVCSDSHTCTHGALGTLAFGIGSTEQIHVMATQTIRQKRPKTMRVRFEGATVAGVEAKDMILYLIGQLGTSAATGYAVEYVGEAITALPMEGRLTLCNLSIELGAKIGMIAPDDVTFDYVQGRQYAPDADQMAAAIAAWKTLATDEGAVFDQEVVIDAGRIRPQITWGTSPEHVMAIDGLVPDPAIETDQSHREAMQNAMAYMRLSPGQRIDETPIDRVFIGSCTNSRLSDLRSAAGVVKGKHVAPHVTAWVVPGSLTVKLDAEREGLDQIFLAAGFEWREPGCSMCVGANGDMVAPGQRCISTSNRNFVGRQGPGALTHLASPAIAAASAIAGKIAFPAASTMAAPLGETA
ncbi:MAG: 3-isopropylmalate dehydratase large subunit [Janthinobacterium lividum]